MVAIAAFFLVSLYIQLRAFTVTGDVSNAMENLYCDLGLGNDYLCPIDGGWTSWSPWGSCSGKCGFKGRRTRRRSCNNPVPANNGASCNGPVYQIESCQIRGCMMQDYEEVVASHPIRKEELKTVKQIHKKLPALIELCFLVDCTFSIVEKILGDSSMIYWNAMNCVKYGIGCPTPGGWSTWGPWSVCTANCGRGQKYRTRVCNSPVPSSSKLVCNGVAFEVKGCVGVNCKKLLTGTWTTWSKWSSCSVECGHGVQIRKRICVEIQDLEGSPCKGSSKAIRDCVINNCSINGMWSVWTDWTPCTSTCGIGTQLRNRMCNNPSPSGNGLSCFGSPSEVRQCFTKPCKVKTHEVAHFTEKSSLLYAISGKSFRLLHIYIRLLPLSPFGMIIYRYEQSCRKLICDYIKLYLQNGKIVLLSHISGCSLGLVHESKLEIGEWHVILVLIYGMHGLLRVDDGPHRVGTFSCTPISYNLDHAMKIGEAFQGQIQEVAINFLPIQLRVSKADQDKYNEKHVNIPVTDNNMQYSMGEENEGFIYVGLTDSVVIPYPKNVKLLHVKIALKVEDTNGIIAVIPDDTSNKFILLLLEEGVIKLKFHKEATFISIESMEHILLGEWFEVIIAQDGRNMYMQVNGNKRKYMALDFGTMITSTTDIFLGALQDELKEKISSISNEIPQMGFTLAYVTIDGNEIDLISLPILETTSQRFSSRAFSVTNYYEEIPLFLGQEIKLSCFYDGVPHEKGHGYLKKPNAEWLLMDRLLKSYGNNDYFNLKDDEHVSTISIASYTSRDAVENFYSCHIYHYRNKTFRSSGQVYFTFGITIIDESEEFLSTLWKSWNIICVAIVAYFGIIIIWCIFELLQDVKNGHGFYRFSKISKNNITSTINFVSSKSGITLLGSEEAANEVVSRILKDNR